MIRVAARILDIDYGTPDVQYSLRLVDPTGGTGAQYATTLTLPVTTPVERVNAAIGAAVRDYAVNTIGLTFAADDTVWLQNPVQDRQA